MRSDKHFLALAGEDFVIMPRREYERLTHLSRAADLPALPKPDRAGNLPAVEYARASLARRLIRQRADAGLSQRQLAKLSGVRFETICRIERGRHTPSVPTIQRLDRAFKRLSASGRKNGNGR